MTFKKSSRIVVTILLLCYLGSAEQTFQRANPQFVITLTSSFLRVDQHTHEIFREDKAIGRLGKAEMPGYIEELSFLQRSEGLFVAYEMSLANEEGAATSFLTLFDLQTFAVKWTVEIPSSGLLTPLFNDDAVLVAASGFIGSVNIRTGAYLWKHSGLGSSYDFAEIRIVKDEVEFCTAPKCLNRDNDLTMIVVNQKSSRISQPPELVKRTPHR
jgi:hypothetical protein